MEAGVDWDSLDWDALNRLRSTFLAEEASGADYWTSPSDVRNYDLTFGQRIAWKWDAVLDELSGQGWVPPVGSVLDWGCGSGVASRRVLARFGAERFKELRLFDRSSTAARYAADAARHAFPLLDVAAVNCEEVRQCSPGLLIVSHVVNELGDADRDALVALCRRSAAVLWAEAGTHRVSRSLVAVREALRGEFGTVGPCTHQARCGMLCAGNERHWCHSFAQPPSGIMGDAGWVRFGQRAGIDLRRLPFSYLALERAGQAVRTDRLVASPERGGLCRIIGEPRRYKGYARLLVCSEDGVREAMLQKRDAPVLLKRLLQGRAPNVLRCRTEGGRIVPSALWESCGGSISNDSARVHPATDPRKSSCG